MKKPKKKKFRKIIFTFQLREGYQLPECQEAMKADERWRHDNIEKGKKYEKTEKIDMVERKMGQRELSFVSKNKLRGFLSLKIHMALHSCWHFYFFVSVSWLSFLVHQKNSFISYHIR